MINFFLSPHSEELIYKRSVLNLLDFFAYVGGIFPVILFAVSFITKGINEFYSVSSIIHNLYKVKVEKKDGEFEEEVEISEL